MKKYLVCCWLLFLACAAVSLFWYTDWQYSKPTPVPRGYKNVKRGEKIMLNNSIPANGQPVFLHFFNPDCPCSRFNAKTFKKLVLNYGSKVKFAVVVMSSKTFTVKAIQEKIGVADIPVLSDTSLARRCGVYSTPQVVLLDDSHHLYYRGNYNVTRYCTDESTNFARIALDGYFNQMPVLGLNRLAFQAYGCSLPACER